MEHFENFYVYVNKEHFTTKEVADMKKLIALVFALVCVLGLVGCNAQTTSTSQIDPSCYVPPVDYAPVEDPTENQSSGAIVEGAFDIAVSYANWIDQNEFYFGALNSDKMAISSVQHLPIYKFDTLEQFVQFKSSYNQSDMKQGYDEVPSFHDTTGDYDETFFYDNTLLLVYISANSGTYRFGVSGVFCDGASFCIHVEQTNNPKAVTCDEAGWLVTVAIPDFMIENCTEFDADLNNDFN